MDKQSLKILVKNIGNEVIGNFVYLYEGNEVLVGRTNDQTSNNLVIFNNLVSRQHCKISLKNNLVYVEDLDSKHGTEIDGVKLTPFKQYPISENQVLTLINGLITLQMINNNEETIDLTKFKNFFPIQNATLNDSFQSVQVKDDVIKMTPKEYQCFKALFNNLGDITDKNDLTKRVWPERYHESEMFVTDEELTSLIYRVRRKVRDHFEIKSIPHKGYYVKYK